MTSLQITIEEFEFEGKPKVNVRIHNYRADDATENEKKEADRLEPLILDVLMSNIKNPVIYHKASWEE